MSSCRRSVRGWSALVTVWLLSAISGCTSIGPGDSGGPAAGTVASGGTTAGSAAPGQTLHPSTPGSSSGSPAAAAELALRSRAQALADGSRVRWLAPLVGSSLREQQGLVFDRMRSMGVHRLRLVSVTELSAAPSPRTSSPGVARSAPSLRPDSILSSTSRVRARFVYRIPSFDTADRTFDINLSLRLPPGGDPQIVAWAPHSRPQPWDLLHLTVRRSATDLVLATDPTQAADLLATAESAQAQVAAVWGHSRPTVWVAPSADGKAALLLGRDPDDPGALRDVAAVTDGPLAAGKPAGADRIVVVPSAWSSLPDRGRDVVATHELTHVVVRGSTTQPVPLWLSEGFAEFVAYRTVALPERDVVRPALDAARQNGLPTNLPTPAEFASHGGSVSAAYGRSLLALRTLADRDGVAAVVRFYREVADPSEPRRPAIDLTSNGVDEPDGVDPALAAVLHTNRSALLGAWRARIRLLLS